MVLGAQIEEIRSITVHSVHGDDGLETHSSRCSLFFPAACMPLFIPRLVLAHSSGLPHPMTGKKVTISAPMPRSFSACVKKLRSL